MHQVKTLVDVFQRHCVGNHWIDFDFAIHVPVHNFWHISTTLRTTEGSPAPIAAGDELEWASGNFLTSTSNADDDGCTPTLVTAFKRIAHDVYIADTFERIIRATFGKVNDVWNEIAFNFVRVDEMRHAKFFAPGFSVVVYVNADNHVGTCKACTLNDVEANTAETEDYHIVTGLNLGSIDYRANPCGYATSNIANAFKRRILAYFCQRNFRYYCMIGKGGSAHVMEGWLALNREPGSAIRHDATTLGLTDGLAEVCFARCTIITLATLRRIKWNDVIALFEAFDTLANIDHNARAFMAKDSRENTFRVSARAGELIRMTQAGSLDFDEDLTFFWTVEIDITDFKWFSGFKCYSSARFHGSFPPVFPSG